MRSVARASTQKSLVINSWRSELIAGEARHGDLGGVESGVGQRAFGDALDPLAETHRVGRVGIAGCLHDESDGLAVRRDELLCSIGKSVVVEGVRR